MIPTVPHVSVTESQLQSAPPLGETIVCKRCGQQHDVLSGDGGEFNSPQLSFVECGGGRYLVGYKGKHLF